MNSSCLIFLAFSFISVSIALTPSVNNAGFDHRAHAVPGGPYIASHLDSDATATVKLNAELSHSHYFNARSGATGKIVKYVWTVHAKVVCKAMICYVKFKQGKTVLHLQVFDNTGDSASGTTHVIVYKGTKPQIRVWYYPGNGWIPDVTGWPKPTFSASMATVDLHHEKLFPKFLINHKFCIRVMGNINLFKQGTYLFRLKCLGGACVMWVGNTLVIKGQDQELESKPFQFSRGIQKIHIIYRRRYARAQQPNFVLSWSVPGSQSWPVVPAKLLSHDPSSYLAVINKVYPANVNVGSTVTIFGSSFTEGASVHIGNTLCTRVVSANQYIIKCTAPGTRGKYRVYVKTSAGISNSVPITISRRSLASKTAGPEKSRKGPLGYYQPLKFRRDYLRKNGKIFEIAQLTAITLGPDNKLYIGSLNGFVHIIETDLGNQVEGYCRSKQVGKSRSILGVAFNPAENGILRLYASTSVLYWGSKKLLSFVRGWCNGEVIAMQQTKKWCLARVATIMSGLPVSNRDHSVNGISFDMKGNMLVSVGGSTNAGVSKKGGKLGGVADSPLSGSIVWGAIMKKNYDGAIVYSQYVDPDWAYQVKGDVHIFSSGLRNSVCSVVHSNGEIYATDNGANPSFGARSINCWKEGSVLKESDTLKKVRKGGFYGYANRNRGRRDRRQCSHVSPHEQVGAEKAIAELEPSTTGLLEYTANTFGGRMRGNLVATKFAVSGSGKVYRIELNGAGNVKAKFEMAAHSGMTGAMSGTGGIVMPRVYQSRIAMLIAKERNPGVMVVTSVNPFRGGQRGGGRVTITGWNLHGTVSVSFGTGKCSDIVVERGGRTLTCSVPGGRGRAAVIVRSATSKSQSFGFEYIYMEV